MKKRGLVIMGLLAIGAVLVLSGCGGGGSSDKRLTKEQFTAKANALCVSFNKANQAAKTPKGIAETITYLEKLTPLYEKRIAGFDKLKPPTSEEATVNQIATLEKKEASLANKLLAALKKNDTATANTLAASGNANSAKVKSLYETLGITECATSS
jgi:hypothetical protein